MKCIFNKTVITLSLVTVFIGTAFSGGVLAETPVDNKAKGVEIATEVQTRDEGWGSSSAKLTMLLSNKQGRTSSRELEIKNLEVEGDGDKALTIFNEPRDVKGTAFLSFSHSLEPDQQWLFLPALKRVKRISSSNKSGPFLGSEFAFEDLSSFEVDKFDYEFIQSETYNDLDMFVVKYIPKYEHSGYTAMHVWIDKEHYRMQKINYYDRKNELLKTLEFNDYKLLNEKFWRSMEYVVANHQTGKKTTLSWRDYALGVELKTSDFSQSALKRAR